MQIGHKEYPCTVKGRGQILKGDGNVICPYVHRIASSCRFKGKNLEYQPEKPAQTNAMRKAQYPGTGLLDYLIPPLGLYKLSLFAYCSHIVILQNRHFKHLTIKNQPRQLIYLAINHILTQTDRWSV
jgi:hypothetical protein